MPIAIYARISTAKEGSEATKRQIDMCHDYLAKRTDLTLYVNNSSDPKLGGYRGAFHDEGKSAWKTGVKRPAWEAVAALAMAGTIDGVLAYASDRIHRRHLEMMLFVSGVLEAGNGLVIYFANGNEPHNFNTVGGRLGAGMMAVMANAEVETLTQRVTDEKYAAAKAGRWNGGRPPFGYRAVRPADDSEGNFIIEQDPVKAPAIVTAVNDYLSGRSFVSVHNKFNEDTGQNLDYNSFFYSLASPSIAGRRMHLPQAKRKGMTTRDIVTTPRFIEKNAKFYKGQWDAIIPFRQWENLRDKLVNNRSAKRGKTPQNSLLAGLVLCVLCGCKMSNDGTTYKVDDDGNPVFMRDGKTPAIKHYPTYRCNKNTGGCGKMQISASGLDALMEAEFLKILPRAIKQGKFTPVQVLEARLIAAQNERSAIDAELDELYVDWKSKKKISEGTYDRLKAIKDHEATVLDGEIASLRLASADQSRLLTAEQVFETLDLNQKNDMFRKIIERIEIRKIVQPAGARNVFHAERVSVVWNLSGQKYQTYGVNRIIDKKLHHELVSAARKPGDWDRIGALPAITPKARLSKTP
ncbi:recombinase family protein [Pseudarthrobacter sp. S3]|uniref:recombinase family protein n=1 Tax=Pseudarthrobacter sp. S3 TaxID=3418419 RepID=UPI003CF3C97B